MKFEDYPTIDRAIILVCGDSGSGKTSLLATAANAGYKVNIADTENKLAVMRKHLTEEGAKRVSSITFKDDLTKKAQGYKAFKKVIYESWKDDKEDLGAISDWGRDTIFAIDSGTSLGELICHEALAMDGKPNFAKMERANWYDARIQVTNLFDYLTGPHFNCHIVMTAIPMPIDDDAGITRFYPEVVTKPFSTRLGKYFDNIVRIDSKRDGSRVIRTAGDNRMSLKVSGELPLEIEADLPTLIKGITA